MVNVVCRASNEQIDNKEIELIIYLKGVVNVKEI